MDRLDVVYQLADYCIDLLQQNEEHHGEVRKLYSKMFHSKIYAVLLNPWPS